MSSQQPERIVDDESSSERGDDERLTTADIASGAVGSMMSKGAPGPNLSNPEEATSSDGGMEPLFDRSKADEFRSRWYGIQSAFVDEPHKSVERADELVATVMQELAEVFTGERENLERDWGSGNNVSTEELRVALKRYRSFFDRLLSV